MAPYRSVVELFQRVRAHFFDTPELDLDPSSVKSQFISSVWRRTITYIWGVRDGVSIPVKIGVDGSLRVESYGSGFTVYETKTATYGGDYSASHELKPTGGAHRWDFLIETDDAKVKFYAANGVDFLPDIPLVAGYYSIPFTSSGVRIASRDGSTSFTYHISAFA